jgi:hypothetical protein
VKSMQFQIPFVYHARAVPPGKRKKIAMSFVDRLLVAVPSATDNEAPIVAEWVHPDRYWDGNSRHRMRMYGGALYSLRSQWDEATCDYVPITPREITVLNALGETGVSEADQEVLKGCGEGRQLVGFEECRDIEDCDREDVEAFIRNRFARLMLTGGQLWEPCDAPMVVMDFAWSAEGVIRAEASTFTSRDACERYISRLPREWYEKPVILDRSRPELLEGIRNAVAPADGPYLPVFELDDIPPNLCGREFDSGVLSFARHALEALPAPLQTYDDTSIANWTALRRAADALEKAIDIEDETDHGVQAVLDALGAAADLTGGRSAFRLGLLNEIWEARDIGHSLARIGTAPRPMKP